MKCGNCGNTLYPGALRCPHCRQHIGSGYHGVPNRNNARDTVGSQSSGSYRYCPDRGTATHVVRETTSQQGTASRYSQNTGTARQNSQSSQVTRQTSSGSENSGGCLGTLLILIVICFGLFLGFREGKPDNPAHATTATVTQNSVFENATPEFTRIPETTAPPTAAPVRYADESLLDSKNWGGCREMEGTVGLLYVFMDDAESAWTQEAMNIFFRDADAEIAKLESGAQNRGIYLDFQTYYENARVDSTIALDNLTQYHNQCVEATGRSAATVNQSLAQQLGVPQAFVVFVFNKAGRSAYYPDPGCECCFLFSGAGSLRHEVCHVFGAADLYYPDELSDLTTLYLGDNTMLNYKSEYIDDLTAYLMGWTDSISYGAQCVLDGISWMTEEDIADALDENVFTGYGTVDFEGGYYEGYFVNGFPHGQCSVYWDNGDSCHTQFDNGIPFGRGTYYWSNGTWYEGEMQDFYAHGYGTMTFNNGYIQTGNWNMGQFLG